MIKHGKATFVGDSWLQRRVLGYALDIPPIAPPSSPNTVSSGSKNQAGDSHNAKI